MRLWASYGGELENVKRNFVVNGMTCASCVANVENAVNNLDGVDKAVVNLTTEKMSVDYAGDKVSPEAIEKAVADAGYEAQVYNPDTAKSQEEREEDKIHKVRERLIWSSVFTIPLFYLAMGQWSVCLCQTSCLLTMQP